MEKKQEPEKKSTIKDMNKVHLNGYLNEIIELQRKSSVKFVASIATVEKYQKDGEWKKQYSFHKAIVNTDNEEVIEKFRKVASDLRQNIDNKDNPNYKPITHTAVLDGSLVRKERTVDNVTYYNDEISVKAENFDFDKPLDKENKESQNRTEIVGNIVKIDIPDGYDFARIRLASHYYAPTGNEETKYEEKTTFIETQINGKFLPKQFEEIKNGTIAVGDKVEARGQINNKSYEDKNGVMRYQSFVDLNKINVVLKKKLTETKGAEQEQDTKETKKKEKTNTTTKDKKQTKKKGLKM